MYAIAIQNQRYSAPTQESATRKAMEAQRSWFENAGGFAPEAVVYYNGTEVTRFAAIPRGTAWTEVRYLYPEIAEDASY